MIGTAAALLGSALIGGGSSLLGGLFGSSAASGASKQQIAAAQQAQKYIQDLLAQYNPQIGTAAQKAADLSTGAGADARAQLQAILSGNRSDVLGGVTQANTLLDPYAKLGTDTLGTLSTLMAPGGDLNRTFNYQDIQNLDPGYQFRQDQAQKALMASAAAKGGALGGGTLQSLLGMSQNMASSEAGAAFSRLTQQQQDRFSRLNSLLGTGFQAAGQQGANITGANQFLASQGLTGGQQLGQWMIQPAQYAGTALAGGAETMANNAMTAGRSIADLMSGAGNAAAAGTVGSANSWSNALAGVASSGSNALILDQILKNPALLGKRV